MRQIDINHVVKKSNWQITKLKKKKFLVMMNLMMIKTLFSPSFKKKIEEPSGSGPHVAK